MVLTRKTIGQDTQIRLMNLLFFMKGFCASSKNKELDIVKNQLEEILKDLR